MINIVNTLASGIAVWTVRTFGRRPLLLFGEAGISLTHICIATFILIQFDIGVLIGICVFMFIY
jgi:Sugar (and other) transporter